MNAAAPIEDDHPPNGLVRSRWRRPVALFLGLALLSAAVVVLLRERATVSAALDALRHAPGWLIALLPALVLANLVLTGLHVRCLLLRFGRVGHLEMQALIAATALANYLPLRPGLAGRLVYHRRVHGIRLRDSGRAVVESLVLGGCSAGWLLLSAVSVGVWPPMVWPMALLPIVLLPIMATMLPRSGWLWWAGVWRYLDLLIWAARYATVFALVGQPIGFVPAAALAVVAVFATLVPLVSNGLGLREWAIGLMAPVVTLWGAGVVLEGGAPLAITADLVNRAVEIVVVLIAGGMGGLRLVREREGAVTRA